MAGKHAQTHIRHHHRHMAQHIKACQYHTTNLRGSDSHSPSHREKKKKNAPASVFLPLLILSTHIPSNLIPEARASFPGEEVNVTELPLRRRCRFPLRTFIPQTYSKR